MQVSRCAWLLAVALGGWQAMLFAGDGSLAARDQVAQALAVRIDRHFKAHWQRAGIEPAPPADDAEFLRRVHLDLAGCIPRVSEAREYLADSRPDKRARLVGQLLESRAHVRHFARVWRDVMLPEVRTNSDLAGLGSSFQQWLTARFEAHTAYDHIVQELLTAGLPAQGQQSTPAPGMMAEADVSPVAFYGVRQSDPAQMATATARAFLGVSLECAQCHDHPFSHWQREEFWELAAFFARLKDPKARAELTIPDSTDIVAAAFLDGEKYDANAGEAPRQALATWLTAADNTYFARATVNRLWSVFFGIGLVQPVDDLDSSTSDIHEDLLNELAAELARSGFDLPLFVRAIVTSQTYQRTSRQTHESQDDPTQFARMSLRSLSAEQFYDSVVRATGHRSSRSDRNLVADTPPAEFVEMFRSVSADPTQGQSSILQALTLMNGRLVADATGVYRSETLVAVAEAPFLDTNSRVETLYLATLSRRPSANELAAATRYIDSTGEKSDVRAALGDVFWSLLNCAEFRLNH